MTATSDAARRRPAVLNPNPEARKVRARLAAYRRWHPDDGPGKLDELTAECMAELNRDEITQAGLDERILDIVDNAPRLTRAQLERLRKLFGTDAALSDAGTQEIAS